MAAEFKTIVHRIQLEPDIQALIKQLEMHEHECVQNVERAFQGVKSDRVNDLLQECQKNTIQYRSFYRQYIDQWADSQTQICLKLLGDHYDVKQVQNKNKCFLNAIRSSIVVRDNIMKRLQTLQSTYV